MGQFMELINDVAFIEFLASVVSLLSLFFYSMDFFKGKTYVFPESSDPQNANPGVSTTFHAASPLVLTTKIRYWFWFSVFHIFLISIWLIFSYIVRIGGIDQLGSDIPAYFAAFPQLFAALLLTKLSTDTPIIGKSLDKFRTFAHARALIPLRAIAMYRKFGDNDLTIPDYWKKRLLNVDDDLVSIECFEARRESVEAKWATILYLFTWIEDRTSNAKSIWARKLANEELGFASSKALFDKLKGEAPTFLNKAKVTGPERVRLETSIEFCLYQLSQLIVCLVFSSTVSDAEADREFRSIGINVGETNRIKLDISILLGSATLLALLAYGAITFGGVLLDGLRITDKPLSLSWRVNSLILSVILIAVPAISVVLIKQAFTTRWITRSEFGKANLGIILIMFPVGVFWGWIVLFVVNVTEIVGPNEDYNRLAFCIISGGASLLAAYCIERRPFIRDAETFLTRAFLASLIGCVVFGLLGTIALFVGAFEPATILNEKIRYIFGIAFASAALGTICGAWLSFSLDYANGFSSERALLRQEVDRYIVGDIPYNLIIGRKYDEVQSFFNANVAKVPNALIKKLVKTGFLSESEEGEVLTDMGHEELYLVASTHH